MPQSSPLSRRAFLKLSASGAALSLLSACRPAAAPLPSTTPTTPPQVTPTLPAATATPQPTVAPTASSTPEPSPTPDLSLLRPEMILVEPGDFMMGALETDPAARPDEHPRRRVQLTRPYYMAVVPVTIAQYDLYCDLLAQPRPVDDGYGRGQQPVIYIDWNMSVAYCNALSELEGLAPCYSGRGKVTRCDFSASGYRLPTEAEWEFAARGGVHSQGYAFAGSDDLDRVAWHAGNSDGRPHPVGELAPNELGLYDLCGNVWEWCTEKYLDGYYGEAPELDPPGPEDGQENRYLGGWDRARRGGAFNESAPACRLSARSFDGQAYQGFASGFRLVRLAGPA